MGTAFQIHCKHCGTHLNYSAENAYGYMPHNTTISNRENHIEIQTSMRCPVCLRRLNNTREEFNEQVKVHFAWD